MLKEFKFSDKIKLVYGNNSSTLKEFIDNLNQDSELYLSTYSVANDKEDTALKKVLEIAKKRKVYLLISKFLFGEKREKRQEKIELFAELFLKNRNISVYCLPRLHSKIYLQKHICYIGSENFNDWEKNIEVGIIIKNEDNIKKIKSLFFDSVLKDAVRIEFDKKYMVKSLKALINDLQELLGTEHADGSISTPAFYDEDSFLSIEKCSNRLEILYATAGYFKMTDEDIEEAFSSIDNLLFDFRDPYGPFSFHRREPHIDHYSDKDDFDAIWVRIDEIKDCVIKFLGKNKITL